MTQANENTFNITLENFKKNPHLNEELKGIIFDIFDKLNVFIPNMNYSLAKDRISTFTIQSKKKYTDLEQYKYDIDKNEMRLNPEMDGQVNALTQSLLEMMIISNQGKGMDSPAMMPIKKGNLIIIANLIIGNNSENEIYDDEHVIANLMNIITGDKILSAFINNDNKFVTSILEEYNLVDINELAINNFKNRHLSKKSILPDIEQKLAQVAFNNPLVNENQKEQFKENIISSSAVMNRDIKYPNLEVIGSQINSVQIVSSSINVSNVKLEKIKVA